MSCQDSSFGPTITGCRSGFDFTLYFQYVILSALPSLVFIFAALARIFQLWQRKPVLGGRRLQTLKLITNLLFFAARPAILGTGLTYSGSLRWSFSLSVGLSIFCALLFIVLSFLEHEKSIRPSTILVTYMAFTILCDAVCIRTYWLMQVPVGLFSSLVTSTALKLVIMSLESIEKRKYIPVGMRPQNPEMTSGIAAIITFFWLNPLLWIGAQRDLRSCDLYNLDSELGTDDAAAKFARVWKDTAQRHIKARSIRSLLWMLKWKILGTIPPRITLLILTVCSPLALKNLLNYLQEHERYSSALGYGFILAFALIYLGIAVSTGLYWYNHFRVITIVRACLVSAISSKAGTIDNASAKDPQATLTLMSSDVERVVEGLRTAHELWANVLQVAVATYLLSREVGVACVIPVLVAIMASTVSTWVSNLANGRQIDWMALLQSRIGVSSNTLLAIKSVKMRGLESTLRGIIVRLRRAELHEANRFRFMGVFTVFFGYAPELLSPVLTFLVVLVRTGSLDATTAFTTLSLIQILAQPLNLSLQNLPFFASTFGCLERIDEYLESTDWIDPRARSENEKHSVPIRDHSTQEKLPRESFDHSSYVSSKAIAFEGASFAYDGQPETLRDIVASVAFGDLVCIIGPVACGKTTFCKAILGEIAPKLGSCYISSPHGKRSVSYCSQEPFIRNRTVKENVIMYSDFDASWYETVSQACGLTRESSGLSEGDMTIAGSDGARLSGGQKQRIAVARALYARNSIMICDDVLSGLDGTSAWNLFQGVFGADGLAKKLGITVVFATHTVRFLPYADHVIVLRPGGTISESGTYDSLRSSSAYVQALATYDTTEVELAKSVDPLTPSSDGKLHEGGDSQQTSSTRLQGEWSTYAYYFNTMKSYTLIILIIFAILVAGFYVVPSYWLKVWTSGSIGSVGEYSYWGVYTCFLCTALFSLPIFEYVSLIQAATQAGVALHDRILQSALNSSWSHFSRIDVGSITNRFSQDLQLIDGELPLGLQNLILSILLALGQAILIAVAAPYVAISFPFIIVILAVVQRFYLRTSRQLRIMDLEAKSPLYTHFTEVIKGCSTIRAFGWTLESNKELLELLESSQKPFYLLNMAQRWLTFVLDVIVAIITALIVAIAVTLRSSSGSVGVALTQVMSTSLILRTIILTWTRVEQSLGAVSRIQDFAKNTPSEHLESENHEPSQRWPKSGEIVFQNLSAIYTSRPHQPAIKQIRGTISDGLKVGICGGSGSGKSSLLLAILHILEFQTGSIEIDGVDIRSVPRGRLRRALNTISQEPLLLTGTIRLNLDPEGQCPDSQLLAALAKVDLLAFVEREGGLDAAMKPESYSSGQRQLFSLASAILRRSKIVLIDEATSNTDAQTDQLMRSVIATEFADCTVVTVAHRLDAIADCDQVIVMGHGCVLEWDSPASLLARDSEFRKLWMKQARAPTRSGTGLNSIE
ncbi:canalicular multispecific organic anion transporter 1 [Pseudovirgaria hyperparasitica]|uniref:Canalicular multispecific organic anion transporter 1 n=1 Tax=Pseudovirgaria hyperparasitica TaxID=470096 RepID=A0A6A6WIK8_9PEZI|nr:canalicular multispecific organic anion transporter 1 [Pseudovirgaria hyperparasitica]KAF2761934.1 canalicular multispecific organic anion transporter 1 [Pseudovirgaria hyperparasitica]